MEKQTKWRKVDKMKALIFQTFCLFINIKYTKHAIKRCKFGRSLKRLIFLLATGVLYCCRLKLVLFLLAYEYTIYETTEAKCSGKKCVSSVSKLIKM